MSNFESLLVLDLKSYISAFAIVNQFCDDKNIKVFEISPIGQCGLLILLIKEELTAQVLASQVESFFSNDIANISLIHQFDEQLLKVYLGQAKEAVLASLVMLEYSFVSEAFQAAHLIIKEGIKLIDFRVIRTQPLNAVLTASASELKYVNEIKAQLKAKTFVALEKAEPIVKDYFTV